MSKRINRMMCVSYGTGQLMAFLYWWEYSEAKGGTPKESQLDTSTNKNILTVEHFLERFRSCFLDTVLKDDGLYVVYSLENASAEQIDYFDRATLQRAEKGIRNSRRDKQSTHVLHKEG